MGFIKNYNFQTLKVKFDDDICFIQIYRPESNNTINDTLIDEFHTILNDCEENAKIIILEGLDDVFCFGADFKSLEEKLNSGNTIEQNPEPLYDLWLKLSTGPYLTIAHVRGRTNAGGIGFVAACDIVLCEEISIFSLSEMLFGLMPACVLPFLIRRIGVAKANYLTLLTQPITSKQAYEWGLVDACEENSKALLRKHLLRLRRLTKKAIVSYKNYINSLNNELSISKTKALNANMEVFSDSENLDKIARYVRTGQFPWESES